MNRKLTMMFALAAIAASTAAAQPGRTVYEIGVFGAGSKSQGLRATLYDERGRPIGQGPVVDTPIGSFRWIPCRLLWESCGRWRVGEAPAGSSYPRENQAVQHYRVSLAERGGRSYWTGELPGLDSAAAPGSRVATPMGTFRWTSGQLGSARWQGWVPQGWPDLPLVAPVRPGRRR